MKCRDALDCRGNGEGVIRGRCRSHRGRSRSEKGGSGAGTASGAVLTHGRFHRGQLAATNRARIDPFGVTNGSGPLFGFEASNFSFHLIVVLIFKHHRTPKSGVCRTLGRLNEFPEGGLYQGCRVMAILQHELLGCKKISLHFIHCRKVGEMIYNPCLSTTGGGSCGFCVPGKRNPGDFAFSFSRSNQ